MTTVGYGDLTPAVGLPRTMAVLEALVGQVFLVVLVARLVSMYKPKPRGARLEAIEGSVVPTGSGEPDDDGSSTTDSGDDD